MFILSSGGIFRVGFGGRGGGMEGGGGGVNGYYWGKNEKGRKLHKNGLKGVIIVSFLVINSENFALPAPTMNNIYPWLCVYDSSLLYILVLCSVIRFWTTKLFAAHFVFEEI